MATRFVGAWGALMYQRILVPVDGSECADFLLGSDAEQIVRMSPVPVLLVRRE